MLTVHEADSGSWLDKTSELGEWSEAELREERGIGLMVTLLIKNFYVNKY